MIERCLDHIVACSKREKTPVIWIFAQMLMVEQSLSYVVERLIWGESFSHWFDTVFISTWVIAYVCTLKRR